MLVPFTQYLMPKGIKTSVEIEMDESLDPLIKVILDRGWKFEIEMLSDYQTVSMTITDDDGDILIETALNGPAVPVAVEKLIRRGARLIVDV